MIRSEINPLPNDILVVEMEQGDKVKKGIIILDDNGKDRGIRPRWSKVYKVGKNIDYVKPGEYVLIEHGRWTRGIKIETSDGIIYVQKIDTNAIMGISETPEHD